MDTSIRQGSVVRVRATLGISVALLLQATPFGAAEHALAAEPQARLTSLDTDTHVSRKGSYTIGWTSADIAAGTALSIQLTWMTADTGIRIGGVRQAGEEARLITTVFDGATMKAFMDKFKSNATYDTIESGRFVWDIGKYCAQNTENGHSICNGAPSFHLRLILRASNDPCGDNPTCKQPRTLFKTYRSRGTLFIVD